MTELPGDANNPLIHPEVDPPGSKNPTAKDLNDLHPNAVYQDYNLAGGKKTKGTAYTPNYNAAKPAS